MPHYLYQFAYTAESWASMIRSPEDRSQAVGAILKAAGGKLVSIYYHAGPFDGIVIAELPDDEAANAVALAATASGTLRASQMSRLYTPKETVDALAHAGKLPFKAPGK